MMTSVLNKRIGATRANTYEELNGQQRNLDEPENSHRPFEATQKRASATTSVCGRLKSTYPTFCIRFLTMMGYKVPPILEPRAIMPKANPSLRLNQWAGQPIMIPKITPHAIWERMNDTEVRVIGMKDDSV